MTKVCIDLDIHVVEAHHHINHLIKHLKSRPFSSCLQTPTLSLAKASSTTASLRQSPLLTREYVFTPTSLNVVLTKRPQHQIGQKIGHEAIPEFHAKTYPPGTAPKEHSYHPNTESDIPGQALNPDMDPSLRTGALDMPGSTSQGIYKDSLYSRPMQGQMSREMKGAHAGKRKGERSGLEGVGASTSDNTIEGKVRRVGADRDA